MRLITLFMIFTSFNLHAMTCPDPNNSSLQWGEPPYPWQVSPFSANPPQGEENTQFVQANILVAGYGRGVSCTYRISTGNYTIWQENLVGMPSRQDHHWIEYSSGYICTESLAACEFFTTELMAAPH